MNHSSDNIRTAVPRLRFPEWEGKEEWEEKQLKDACTMQAGKFVSAVDINEKKEDGLFPCYGGNGLRGYTRTSTHEGVFPLIGRQGALCGNITLAGGQFHATEHAVVSTPKDGIDVNWLYYSLVLRNLNQYATGQAQPGLSVDNLEKVKVFIPKTEKEQQKIASCLSSLDDLIAAHSQKLEALKAHKKGLMQQLFPTDGETVPRLRFKEFEGSGEWEEKVLGEVAMFLKGKGIAKSDIEIGGVIPCIRYGELYTRYKEVIVTIASRTNVSADNLLLSEANDVIVPSSGETKEDIAKASCVSVSGVALGSDLNIIRSPLNGVFLSYYLNGAKKKEIARVAQGDTVVHLYNTQLTKLAIRVPSSEEQQKIASGLSSLDALIAAQAEKLEALKDHKKGLMQDLFPQS